MLFLLLLIIFLFVDHFLIFIISIEFVLIFNLSYLLIVYRNSSYDFYFLFLLVIGVCESVFGLTLIVRLVHIYGSERIKILNLRW